ncbi:MAG: integration host factor, partial [Deltaproteobacteria bacterium RIFOXYA12_FULL_61_11]
YADVNEICDHLFNVVADTVHHDARFSWPGFGTWTVRARAARRGRNPQTGAVIDIPASKTVAFKVAPALKDLL